MPIFFLSFGMLEVDVVSTAPACFHFLSSERSQELISTAGSDLAASSWTGLQTSL